MSNVDPNIVSQLEHTPEQVAAAKEVYDEMAAGDPTILRVDVEGSLGRINRELVAEAQAQLENGQDWQGNRLVKAHDRHGKIIWISPVSVSLGNHDPFPEIGWPEDSPQNRHLKSIVEGKSGSLHGGFLRTNPDTTVSFKPTSFVGKIVTAPNEAALRDLLQ